MNTNHKIKTILIFGGTGFIGNALALDFSRQGDIVIATTRKSSHLLPDISSDAPNAHPVRFIPDCDLTDTSGALKKIFPDHGAGGAVFDYVINCAAETGAKPKKNIEDSKKIAETVAEAIRIARSTNPRTVSFHFGSIAEYSEDLPLPPYERSKIDSWRILDGRGLIDFHLIPFYVKGAGEIKMTAVAEKLWGLQRWSRRWLWGHNADITDVNTLAGSIDRLARLRTGESIANECYEVFLSNGSIPLGEMVECLLPSVRRDRLSPLFSGPLEKIFLSSYSLLATKIFPDHQYSRRLAFFAKRALNPNWGYGDISSPGERLAAGGNEMLIDRANSKIWLGEKYSAERLKQIISGSRPTNN